MYSMYIVHSMTGLRAKSVTISFVHGVHYVQFGLRKSTLSSMGMFSGDGLGVSRQRFRCTDMKPLINYRVSLTNDELM